MFKRLVPAILLAGTTHLFSPNLLAAAERYQLGVFAPESVITVNLPKLVSAGTIVIEIDGQTTEAPFGVNGRTIQVTIPKTISGSQHDLVVTNVVGGQRELLGIWEFSTPSGGHAMTAVQAEAGMRAGNAGQIDYYQAGGRLDFDLGNGFSGGLSFGATGNSDPATNDAVELQNFHLESKSALWGDELSLRAGSQYLDTVGQLVDQGDRRGLSAKLSDPAGAYEVTLFATETALSTGTSNLFGVEDSNDRLIGISAHGRPLAGAPLQIGVTGFSGAAPGLPGAAQSANVGGLGASFSAPIADLPLDVSGYFDKSWHGTATGSANGSALGLDMNWSIDSTHAELEQTLALKYEKIGVDFFSPLNPDLITGEQGVALTYARYGHEWSLETAAGLALTNAGGPASAPVDRLSELSVFATFSPDTMTGGFLNGTTFFASANVLQQLRFKTPLGASAAQDNTVAQISGGFSRFQKDNSFSLIYSYDNINLHAGSANDRKVHTLRGLYSGAVTNRVEASMSGVVRQNINSAGASQETELSGLLKWDAIPDQLNVTFGVGGAWYEDPATPDYVHIYQEAAWTLNDRLELVASADYRDGPSTLRAVPGDGWSFGLAIRAQLSQSGAF